jgi:hypothetical protein
LLGLCSKLLLHDVRVRHSLQHILHRHAGPLNGSRRRYLNFWWSEHHSGWSWYCSCWCRCRCSNAKVASHLHEPWRTFGPGCDSLPVQIHINRFRTGDQLSVWGVYRVVRGSTNSAGFWGEERSRSSDHWCRGRWSGRSFQ